MRRNAEDRVEDEVSQHGENPGRQEEEAIPPPPPENRNPTLTDVLAALAAQNLNNQANRVNPTLRAMEVMREFSRMNPPRFDGLASDPLAADHWLTDIQKACQKNTWHSLILN